MTEVSNVAGYHVYQYCSKEVWVRVSDKGEEYKEDVPEDLPKDFGGYSIATQGPWWMEKVTWILPDQAEKIEEKVPELKEPEEISDKGAPSINERINKLTEELKSRDENVRHRAATALKLLLPLAISAENLEDVSAKHGIKIPEKLKLPSRMKVSKKLIAKAINSLIKASVLDENEDVKNEAFHAVKSLFRAKISENLQLKMVAYYKKIIKTSKNQVAQSIAVSRLGVLALECFDLPLSDGKVISTPISLKVSKQIILTIFKALDDKHKDVRQLGAYILYDLIKGAEDGTKLSPKLRAETIPYFIRALKNKDKKVVQFVQAALDKLIRSPEISTKSLESAARPLINKLKDPDKNIQSNGAIALENMLAREDLSLTVRKKIQKALEKAK